MAIPKLLKDLLTIPTAPFVEHAVLDYVRAACGRYAGLSVKADRCGNLLVRYRHHPPRRRTPLVFSAHTDHPGFVALEMVDPRTVRAAFRGWVEAPYFAGTGVRFWSGGRWVGGRVSEVTRESEVFRMIGRVPPPEEVLARVESEVTPNAPGMWDLPDPALRDRHVFARACDDLAGVAALLALLERLSRKRAPADVYCLFTRAEEVGFIGAIGACKAGSIPKGAPVVAIETSKTLPNAPLGAGPILRVGDKSSVFSPHVTQFCNRVAADLARRRRKFAFQRKLMDGGTCESTAFAAFGYPTTGICLALGNYHNMDTERRRIDSEFINLDDWKLMVDWFEALALDETGCVGEHARTRRELDARYSQLASLLGGPGARSPKRRLARASAAK